MYFGKLKNTHNLNDFQKMIYIKILIFSHFTISEIFHANIIFHIRIIADKISFEIFTLVYNKRI